MHANLWKRYLHLGLKVLGGVTRCLAKNLVNVRNISVQNKGTKIHLLVLEHTMHNNIIVNIVLILAEILTLKNAINY